MTTEYAVKKPIWVNIIFFSVTGTLGLIGTPIYIYHYGVSAFEIGLFLFYVAATAMGITVGYHRLFSHVTYKANSLVRFLLLFFGGAAFEQTALDWCSQHRDHHQYVDTDRDPYNIKKGFLYAHIGWLVAWKHKLNYDNVKDLQEDKMIMHQHNHYLFWCIGAGIILPTLIGAFAGYALGAFLIAVCLRLTVVYHSTFFINSICHMFGKPTYDIHATAKDNWLIAFLTFGEGYHNFHHRFPSDYRNAVRWYQWDPSKWVIALMGKIGLAWDLKRVSYFKILDARLKGENKKISEGLLGYKGNLKLNDCIEKLKLTYQDVRSSLARWEEALHDFQKLKDQAGKIPSSVSKKAALKLEKSAEAYKNLRKEWREMVHLPPPKLEQMLLAG